MIEDEWWHPAVFLVGAIVLVLELERRATARVPVVVLALVLMGVVTLSQLGARTWARDRRPRMPVEGLQHPQEPPEELPAP